jgi:hypothetical protein
MHMGKCGTSTTRQLERLCPYLDSCLPAISVGHNNHSLAHFAEPQRRLRQNKLHTMSF